MVYIIKPQSETTYSMNLKSNNPECPIDKILAISNSSDELMKLAYKLCNTPTKFQGFENGEFYDSMGLFTISIV